MFTHVFQFFLVAFTFGVVAAASITAILDVRENRAKKARLYQEAMLFAGDLVAKRTAVGYYEVYQDTDAREDYNTLRNNYIQINQ